MTYIHYKSGKRFSSYWDALEALGNKRIFFWAKADPACNESPVYETEEELAQYAGQSGCCYFVRHGGIGIL